MNRFVRTIGWLVSIHVSALVVFSLFRLMEFISLRPLISTTSSSIWPAFLRGLWFDNVIACYIMIVPLVVVMAAAVAGRSSHCLRRGVTVWCSICFALAFAASAANIPYFAYFFKNINASIFGWFGYVSTTFGMLFEEKSYWFFIVGYIAVTAVFIWWLEQLEHNYIAGLIALPQRQKMRKTDYAVRAVVSIVLVLLCVFGIRGRTGYNPIKISEAYYCNDAFLNQLGINPAFNLITSVIDDMRKENKELSLMPYNEAIAFTRTTYGIGGKVDSMDVMKRTVVNKPTLAQRPNVVIILMESMSASLMKEFGQQQPLTPTLDSLYQHSLAFTNFYSAGIHTNHGMTATLYSFPALMFRNLMKGTVTPHRKGLPTVLKQLGYDNMFFMTHEAQYDNMKAFFLTNGYKEIFSQESYPKDSVVNSFGVSDHFEFDFALQQLNNKAKRKQPFMATILTISNHPPYVVPEWFKARTKDPETQIVEYADWAIGDFLRKARKQPWYKNTIFVIQADHGKMVGKSDVELPESYNHIPLIMFGPGIKPMKYNGLGMQVDVMPTLLGLMGVSYNYDGFGVDLLKVHRNVVFYSADNQIVARDNRHCYIYEPATKQSFCYTAAPDGTLSKSRFSPVFAGLRRYVFSMIQTAQYMLLRQ